MMNKINFSIDGDSSMPIYAATDVHPQRWNGWLRPIVTIKTALQIAEDIFNKDNLEDNEPYYDIQNAIIEAKENFEETVEVGLGICWHEVLND
mgnify:CR=1 FL=1|tara:strand:+ start:237 stop:515 length:279 start_codon:yes stop_codon:yes gene_type:complete